jgi:DNA-binding response OmpR family regulator
MRSAEKPSMIKAERSEARETFMAQTRHILIVDDDSDLRNALAEQLALHEEFEVSTAENVAGARAAVAANPPDLIVMDVGLPDMDGREAVRLMRKEGFKRPILMLTAHDSDADTVLGLDAGANDYISKPFRFAVLLARLRVQLRQHEASEDAEFQIGPYTFRPASKNLVNAKGARLRLTEKEAAILRFLHRADRQVVSREVLLKDVWGYNANVTTHTLETHIYRLRQKIEIDPTDARLLVTDAGGYKLLP